MESSHKAYLHSRSKALDFLQLKQKDRSARIYLPGSHAWVPDKDAVFEPATVVETIEVSSRKFAEVAKAVKSNTKAMKPNSVSYVAPQGYQATNKLIDNEENGKLVIYKGDKLQLKKVSVKASKSLKPMKKEHLEPKQKLSLFSEDLSDSVIMHYLNHNFNNKDYDYLLVGERTLLYCNRFLSQEEKIDRDIRRMEALEDEEDSDEEDEDEEETKKETEFTVENFAIECFHSLNEGRGNTPQSLVLSGDADSGRRAVSQDFVRKVATLSAVNDPTWWEKLQAADQILTLFGGENFLRWTELHLGYSNKKKRKSAVEDENEDENVDEKGNQKGKLIGAAYRSFLLDTASIPNGQSATFKVFSQICKASPELAKKYKEMRFREKKDYYYLNGGTMPVFNYTKADVEEFYRKQEIERKKREATMKKKKEAKEKLAREKREREERKKAQAKKVQKATPKETKTAPRKVGKLKNVYQQNLEKQKKQEVFKTARSNKKCKFEGCPKDAYIELEFCLDHIDGKDDSGNTGNTFKANDKASAKGVSSNSKSLRKQPQGEPSQETRLKKVGGVEQVQQDVIPDDVSETEATHWEETTDKLKLLGLNENVVKLFLAVLSDMMEIGNVEVYVSSDSAAEQFSSVKGKTLLEDKEFDEEIDDRTPKKKFDIYSDNKPTPVMKRGVIQNELNLNQDRHKDELRKMKNSGYAVPLKFLVDKGEIKKEYFGVDLVELAEVINIRMLKIGTEFYMKAQSKTKCLARKDSIVRALYSGLFNWLLNKINSGISHTKDSTSKQTKNLQIGIITVLESVGLLLGASGTTSNLGSLEQLIHNYAEEKLYSFYTINILERNAKRWTTDSIPLNFKEGNELVLPLIVKQNISTQQAQQLQKNNLGKTKKGYNKRMSMARTFSNINAKGANPKAKTNVGTNIGILNILEDELRGLQMSSKKIIARIEKTHKLHNNLVLSPNKYAFTVQHFGAKISYDVKSFVKKTMSAVLDEQIQDYIINNTKNPLVKQLLTTFSPSSQQKELLKIYEESQKQIKLEIAAARLAKKNKQQKMRKAQRNRMSIKRMSFRRNRESKQKSYQGGMERGDEGNQSSSNVRNSMNFKRRSIGRVGLGMTMTFNLAGLIRPKNTSEQQLLPNKKTRARIEDMGGSDVNTFPDALGSQNRNQGTDLEIVDLSSYTPTNSKKSGRTRTNIDTRLRKNKFIQNNGSQSEAAGTSVTKSRGLNTLQNKFQKQGGTKKSTTSTMVRDTLNTVVTMLDLTSPRFVFCFSSNPEKQSTKTLDSGFIYKQLILSGIKPFLGKRFGECSFGSGMNLETMKKDYQTLPSLIGDRDLNYSPEVFMKRVMDLGILPPKSYVIGSSTQKIYLKQDENCQFDLNTLNSLAKEDIVIFLQKTFRRCFARKWYWFSLEADFARKLKKATAANNLELLEHLVSRVKYYGFRSGLSAAEGKITRLRRDNVIKGELAAAVESDNILKLYSALQLARDENLPLCKELSEASALYGKKSREQDRLIAANQPKMKEQFKGVVDELQMAQEVDKEVDDLDMDAWINQLKQLKEEQDRNGEEDSEPDKSSESERPLPRMVSNLQRPKSKLSGLLDDGDDGEEFFKQKPTKSFNPSLKFYNSLSFDDEEAGEVVPYEDLAEAMSFNDGYNGENRNHRISNQKSQIGTKYNKHFSFSTIEGAQSVQSSEISENDWVAMNTPNLAKDRPETVRFRNFAKFVGNKIQGSKPGAKHHKSSSRKYKSGTSIFNMFTSKGRKRNKTQSERSVVTVGSMEDEDIQAQYYGGTGTELRNGKAVGTLRRKQQQQKRSSFKRFFSRERSPGAEEPKKRNGKFNFFSLGSRKKKNPNVRREGGKTGVFSSLAKTLRFGK
eukprot:augustus_masked-scaffold_12-processed-gene-11.12-mRNA-1 protein AED:1.00 eAED:1.00 QI:0/-1/0/0/-1/1/1/0/1862